MAYAMHAFVCPISGDMMRDPVITADGHTYERAHIKQWLAGHDTSPATGAQLPNKNLTANVALRQAIEEWEETHALHIQRADIELPQTPISVGPFKTVYKGKLRVHVPGGQSHTRTAAVLKLTRQRDCSTAAQMFLRLGRHPSLVQFYGQCINKGGQLLLTEFAGAGRSRMPSVLWRAPSLSGTKW